MSAANKRRSTNSPSIVALSSKALFASVLSSQTIAGSLRFYDSVMQANASATNEPARVQDEPPASAPLLARAPPEGNWWQKAEHLQRMRTQEILYPRGLSTTGSAGRHVPLEFSTMLAPDNSAPPAFHMLFAAYMGLRTPIVLTSHIESIAHVLQAETAELQSAYEFRPRQSGYTVPARTAALWLLVGARHPDASVLYDGFAHMAGAHEATNCPLSRSLRTGIAVGTDADAIARHYGILRTWAECDALLVLAWLAPGEEECENARSMVVSHPLRPDTLLISNTLHQENNVAAKPSQWTHRATRKSTNDLLRRVGGQKVQCVQQYRDYESIAELFRGMVITMAEKASAPVPLEALLAPLPLQGLRVSASVRFVRALFASLREVRPASIGRQTAPPT